MPVSDQGRGFSRELHEATYKPLDQGLGSQYYLASVAETETLHHPLSTLTPVWPPPKCPELLPKTQALHVKGQGQRERIAASQGKATCPQIVLLLLWVVKPISNMAPENSPLMKLSDPETEDLKSL